jgi:arylsulfatase A-like enzyme
VLGLVGAFVVLLLGGCTVTAAPPDESGQAEEAPAGGATTENTAGDRPDIVFILMDDFSLELLETMPQALRMQREGATYRNAFVVDSLCCPSRAALLTGQTPHQTGVLTNTRNDPDDPIGGYPAFVAHGNEERQVSVTLQDGGYATGFTGKFLNEYNESLPDTPRGTVPAVPGWTEWNAILGGGYGGWHYRQTELTDDGTATTRLHRAPPRDAPRKRRDRAYVTNVMARDAERFIDEYRGEAPYFLTVSTYAPHVAMRRHYDDDPRFPPAFADRPRAGDRVGGNCGAKDCGDLSLDDLTGYGDPRGDNAPTYLRSDGGTEPAPAWRTNPITMTDGEALRYYRDRARMVQSVDRLIKRVRRAAGKNAYVVLTSDNGYHLGQHQLNGGKGAPYDSDTRVPLVVVGPDVVPGERRQYVNNIDLAPTFEELAGVATPDYRAGRSFADSLTDPKAPGARYAFFEHTYAKIQPGEVDLDEGAGGTIDIIPSYIAVRGERGLLVRLDLDPSWDGTDHAWELYRYDVPFEDRNVFAEDHDKPWARDLMERLEAFDDCEPAECREAAR